MELDKKLIQLERKNSILRIIEKSKLALIFFLLSFLLFLNFFKALPYDLLTLDGFQYLQMAKSFWSFKFDYIIPYRTPLMAIFLVPNVKLARLEIIFLYLSSFYLFHQFLRKRLKMNKTIVPVILFFFCAWNIIFTLEIASEYFSFFFLLLGFLNDSYICRSIFLSFSFLLRPDSILLILPFFLFIERDRRVIPLFLLSSIITDFFLFFAFYRSINISFILFFVENFIKRMPWKISRGGFYWLRFLQFLPYYLPFFLGIFYVHMSKERRNFLFFSLILVTLLGFLPVTNDRIFFLKILFLVSIVGTFLIERLENYGYVIVFSFLLFNILIVVRAEYPAWLRGLKCLIYFFTRNFDVDICQNLATYIFFKSLSTPLINF